MNNKKRLLSLVTALTLTASAFAGFATSASADNSANTIAYDGANVTVSAAGQTSAVLIRASYDGDVLKSAKVTDLTFTDGVATAALTADVGDKFYVWNALNGETSLQPLVDAPYVVKPVEHTVYINENFDEYDVGEVIKTAGNDQTAAYPPVTKGSITYAAGHRNNGSVNTYSSISATADGKEFVVSSDGYCTSGRGVSFTFNADAGIPTVNSLADTDVLELSFKVKATQSFTITGYGDITVADLANATDYVLVRVILDKGANKQYQIVTDLDGNVLTSKVAALTATTFTGMTFYVGSGAHNIDDIRVENKAKDTGIIDAVVMNGEAGLADATITVGSATYTTDANGQAAIAVPNGEYKVVASKNGYEHTAGMEDNHEITVTVNSDSPKADLSLVLRTYIKVPDTVTITGGQTFIAAPKTADTASAAAFTVEVLDQFELPMTKEEYGLTWAVYPAGTEEADANVTIDANGVVTVSKNFNIEEKVKAFDVVAVAATEDRNNKVTKTLYVANNDIIYYEGINWVQGGGTGNRNGSTNLLSAVTLPDMSSVTMNVNFPSGTDGNSNIALISDGNTKLVGLQLQSSGTIKAWTGWSGNSAMNQYSDVDAFGASGTLVEGYSNGTTLTVSFVIDKASKTITVNCGGVTLPLTYTVSPTSLTGLQFGQYRGSGAVTVEDITVQEPDVNYLSIAGDVDFAKVSGQTLTRTYALGQSVLVTGETFTWTVEGDSTDGITIADGVLSVTDAVVPGTYTIKAVSDINADKAAELPVVIADFQGDADEVQVTLAGAQAYNTTDTTGTYSVAKVTDKYGDDITALLPAAVWTADNDDVVTITEDGTLTVVGAGEATVTATITNGTATIIKTVPVKVSAYSITGDATGASTTVDTSVLVTDSAVTKYLVTTATADGKKVKSTKVAASDITSGSYTVDTTGADKFEIAPIYSYDIGNAGTIGVYGAGFDIAIPADTYNFTVDVTGSRCDVYANNQLLVNNILQGGSAITTVEVNDIVVKEGVAKITTADYSSGQTSAGSHVKIDVVKSPSIVTRETKMYVLGDSLVCVYYNGAGPDANWQTGWGQPLVNYVKGVEIVNLANSGATANGLVGSAFTQVLESAKEGDYLVLESGYNDRTYDTEAVMKNALTTMIEKSEERGVKVILVSPNASAHTYSASASWTGYMEDVATATGTDYIDLSQISYDFFHNTYADDTNGFKVTYNVSDRLHSTYHGAQKMASIVAQGLYDLGHTDIINTDYEYSFVDYLGNTITCKIDTTAE